MDQTVRPEKGRGAAEELAGEMMALGRRARQAADILTTTPGEAKNAALHAIAATLREASDAILAANAHDLDAVRGGDRPAAFVDRLTLDAARIEAMARGVEEIAALDDPVGTVIAAWTRPNGLRIERVRTPLGVVGIIFESRPNVTCDAGALCLKAGNAAILRPGSESFHSSRAIHAAMVAGLRRAGLPQDAIQLVPTTDRAAVGLMLAGLGGAVDVLVPPDLAVAAEAHLGVGEIQLLHERRKGFGGSLKAQTADFDSAPRRVRIRINLGVGDINVARLG